MFGERSAETTVILRAVNHLLWFLIKMYMMRCLYWISLLSRADQVEIELLVSSDPLQGDPHLLQRLGPGPEQNFYWIDASSEQC